MNCEGLLLKTAIGEDGTSQFDTVTEFYGSDFLSVALQGHLHILGSNSSMSYLNFRTTSICQICLFLHEMNFMKLIRFDLTTKVSSGRRTTFIRGSS